MKVCYLNDLIFLWMMTTNDVPWLGNRNWTSSPPWDVGSASIEEMVTESLPFTGLSQVEKPSEGSEQLVDLTYPDNVKGLLCQITPDLISMF